MRLPPSPPPDPALDRRLWLAVNAFRDAAILYAVVLYAFVQEEYRYPWLGWGVLGILALWTLFLTLRSTREPWMHIADLALAVGAVLSTRVLDDPDRIAAGAQTLPSIWPAAAVLSWAVWRGWRGGLFAAGVIAVADLIEVGRPTVQTVNNIVLLVLVGTIVGVGVELIRAGRAEMADAVAVRAATAERERLARDIHDSVLQVLGYVSRRGRDLDGPAAEFGRLAGEQEARLRAMVASGPAADETRNSQSSPTAQSSPIMQFPFTGARTADLRPALSTQARSGVTVSGPAEPVLLPVQVVEGFAAATAAALDNVERHAGPNAQAWVLLEDEGDWVVVTIRDDGAGFAPGRLAAAAEEGRLGVSSSIRGRIEDLGGRVNVLAVPGRGAEVELRVPRPAGRSHDVEKKRSSDRESL